MLVGEHEAEEAYHDGLDLPDRVPLLRVPVTDRQTDARPTLEAPAGGKHDDRGWLHWVLLGELEHAVVVAPLVGAPLEVVDAVVPVENVVWVWLSHEIRVRVV